MGRKILFAICCIFILPIYANEYSWQCAVEWTEENPEWVFVYEDIKINQDGNYRIFVKWDFPGKSEISQAKQTWLIAPDFDQVLIVSNVGFNQSGEIIYSENYPYGDWKYVLPDSYAASIIKTMKEILYQHE